jgi:hypothetical protein
MENRKMQNGQMDNVSLSLNAALIENPDLLNELPQVIDALEAGEAVNIDNISNIKKREALHSILGSLPIRWIEGVGYLKKQKEDEVANKLMQILIDEGTVRQTKNLNSAENVSSRSAPLILIELFSQYPALIQEIPLLEQILNSESAVQLDGISDETIVEYLERLLKSLGFVETDEGLSVPFDENNEDMVIEAVKHFKTIFKQYEKYLKLQKKKEKKHKSQQDKSLKKTTSKASKKEKSHSKSSSTSSSSSSNAEDDESSRSTHSGVESDESERAANKQSKLIAIKGPQRPSASEYQLASQLLATSTPMNDEDDDQREEEEDDAFGPTLPSSSYQLPVTTISRKQRILNTFLPVGFDTTADESVIHEYLTGKKRKELSANGEGGIEESLLTEKPTEGKLKREEWILDPGQSNALKGNDSLYDSSSLSLSLCYCK